MLSSSGSSVESSFDTEITLYSKLGLVLKFEYSVPKLLPARQVEPLPADLKRSQKEEQLLMMTCAATHHWRHEECVLEEMIIHSYAHASSLSINTDDVSQKLFLTMRPVGFQPHSC